MPRTLRDNLAREIYAQVQKRIGRPEVKRKFEQLVAGYVSGGLPVPAEPSGKMSPQTAESANQRSRRSAELVRGPQNWPTNAESNPRG